MNRHEAAVPTPGTGTDAPRVPVSATAWSTESAQALAPLTTSSPEEGAHGAHGTGELLRDPGAWKHDAATGSAGASTSEGPESSAGAEGSAGPDRAAGPDRSEKPAGDARPGPGSRPRAALDVLDVLEPTRRPGTGKDQRPDARTPQRRSSADPVKVLMHRHRDLCARAVDPLEIAVGLEAHGMTDRAAARFRHKDVFSLAEEMYARVPRDGAYGRGEYGHRADHHAAHGPGHGEPGRRNEPGTSSPGATSAPAPATGLRRAWAVLALLPGAVSALTLSATHVTSGTTQLTVGVCGALAVAAALRTTLRCGPLRPGGETAAPSTRLWVWYLLAYALLGDGLLTSALAGGPDDTWTPATAPLLALAVAVAPAALCARLYTSTARRRLATSRGLAEFAASARPLLLGTLALFTLALATLLGLSGALLDQSADYAGAGTLGVLLLLTRLLIVHGRTHAPAIVLGAAVGTEALAVATVFAARLPGCDVLGKPVEAAVDALGAGVVPGLACGAGALTLLVHATRTLTRASAHAGDCGPGGAP